MNTILLAIAILVSLYLLGAENLTIHGLLLLATVIAIIFLLISRNWRTGHNKSDLNSLLYISHIARI